MKKTRMLSIFSMFIATCLIITGYSMIFISDYVVDAKETQSSLALIKNSYSSYMMDVEVISSEIKAINAFDIKYYKEFKEQNTFNNQILRNLEQKIKNIETTSELLLDECSNRGFNDYEIENKCLIISENYESLINTYVSIVQNYNERLDSYNNFYKNDKLPRYYSDYYDKYVDINGDKIFLGKI